MIYKVFRKLETGELLVLASFEDLDRAKQLIASLEEHWPGDYFVRDSLSNPDGEPKGESARGDSMESLIPRRRVH
jgi:hypothetical protein